MLHAQRRHPLVYDEDDGLFEYTVAAGIQCIPAPQNDLHLSLSLSLLSTYMDPLG